MKHKRFEFYRNWYWLPKCGHYGFVRIFSKPSIGTEEKEELRKWFDHLGGGPVFPED